MSTTPARKPPPPGSTGRKDSAASPATPGSTNRTPARASTPTNGANGVQRTRSVRTNSNTPLSARAAARKPGASSALNQSSSPPDTADDDAREEAAAALQDLKERLEKAETESEERQRQIEVLNARLDDSLKEQTKLEERAHEEEEKVEALENEKRELNRKQRELEGIYEAERAQAMKDKDEFHTKEEELLETIQRLKEALANKDMRTSEGEEGVSRTCEDQFKLSISLLIFAQRASAILEATHRKTSRARLSSHRHRRSSEVIPGITPSSSTRRTRSSKGYGLNWQKCKSNW